MEKDLCLLGLRKDRFNQLMEFYDNDINTVNEIVNSWGIKACNNGYEIFDFDGTGMLEIELIGDIGCFEDDEKAVIQAEKDGINIIPINELPENFNRRYYGWIDTKENREAIQKYCEKYC